jgi:hypothetical protein
LPASTWAMMPMLRMSERAVVRGMANFHNGFRLDQFERTATVSRGFDTANTCGEASGMRSSAINRPVTSPARRAF